MVDINPRVKFVFAGASHFDFWVKDSPIPVMLAAPSTTDRKRALEQILQMLNYYAHPFIQFPLLISNRHILPHSSMQFSFPTVVHRAGPRDQRR